MTFFQIAITIMGSLASLGIVAGGLGYLISSYKKGSGEQRSEVINSADQLTNFWKEQVEGFKEMVATQNEKIRTLTGDVGELRGQLNAEKKQNAELQAILQGRGPEQKQFMDTMLAMGGQAQKFMADHGNFQLDQQKVMGEIKTFMSGINENLATVNKDLKIEATVTKQ